MKKAMWLDALGLAIVPGGLAQAEESGIWPVQYHFMPDENIQLYVGAGVNFTRSYSVKLSSNSDMKRDSWRGAPRAGVDIPLDKSGYLNFDVKNRYINTDVKSAGGRFRRLRPTQRSGAWVMAAVSSAKQ